MYIAVVVCFLEGAPTNMQRPHMIACNHNKMAVGVDSFQAMKGMRLVSHVAMVWNMFGSHLSSISQMV